MRGVISDVSAFERAIIMRCACHRYNEDTITSITLYLVERFEGQVNTTAHRKWNSTQKMERQPHCVAVGNCSLGGNTGSAGNAE